VSARSFTIPGKPIAKGRPRLSRNGHAYTPERTRTAESCIQDAYLRAYPDAEYPPMQGPLRVTIRACFSVPKSWSKAKRAAAKWHTGRPDIDNICKTVTDALNTVAFPDDSQVCDLNGSKPYGDHDHTVVTIEEVS
jgi:Holliday junction resolvase RusA-like endonuclease